MSKGVFTIIRQSNTNLELIAKQTEAQEWMQTALHKQFSNEDFAVNIGDGNLLCQLLNAIKPGCIKKINPPSSNKFKAAENIATFLNTCKTVFNIPDTKLFVETDLVDRRNMLKVVDCIHAVSEAGAKMGFSIKMERLIPDDWQFTTANTFKNQVAKSKVDDEIGSLQRREKRRGNVAELRFAELDDQVGELNIPAEQPRTPPRTPPKSPFSLDDDPVDELNMMTVQPRTPPRTPPMTLRGDIEDVLAKALEGSPSQDASVNEDMARLEESERKRQEAHQIEQQQKEEDRKKEERARAEKLSKKEQQQQEEKLDVGKPEEKPAAVPEKTDSTSEASSTVDSKPNQSSENKSVEPATEKDIRPSESPSSSEDSKPSSVRPSASQRGGWVTPTLKRRDTELDAKSVQGATEDRTVQLTPRSQTVSSPNPVQPSQDTSRESQKDVKQQPNKVEEPIKVSQETEPASRPVVASAEVKKDPSNEQVRTETKKDVPHESKPAETKTPVPESKPTPIPALPSESPTDSPKSTRKGSMRAKDSKSPDNLKKRISRIFSKDTSQEDPEPKTMSRTSSTSSVNSTSSMDSSSSYQESSEEKTRSWKTRNSKGGTMTLNDLEKQYKGNSPTSPPITPSNSQNSLAQSSSTSSVNSSTSSAGKQDGGSSSSYGSYTVPLKDSGDSESGSGDTSKFRQWKKRASLSLGTGNKAVPPPEAESKPVEEPEPEPAESSPQPRSKRGSMSSSGEQRRSFSLKNSFGKRTGSTSFKDIEKFYSDMKQEASKMNTSEVIEQQIRKNKEEVITSVGKRVELRDREDEDVAVSAGVEDEEDRRERIRIEVISEIMMSERYYVRDLELVVSSFLRYIQSNNLLARDEIEGLFSNLELILKVNQAILSNIIEDFQATKNIQLMNMGAIFLKMVDYLKIYSIYAGNQANSVQVYAKFKKEKKDFAQFVEMAEKRAECQGINLLGFLIKPVQRICKYPLLFRELLKHTHKDHVDYKNIEHCLNRLQEVAEYVNEKQRMIESVKKMVELQENLVDQPKGFQIVSPSRKYLREATFIKVNDKGKQQDRELFLFNDILLYCKSQLFKKKLEYKGVIPLSFCLIVDLPDTSDIQNSFHIIRIDGQTKRKYLFGAPTAAEKILWMTDLNKIIDENLKAEKSKTRSNYNSLNSAFGSERNSPADSTRNSNRDSGQLS